MLPESAKDRCGRPSGSQDRRRSLRTSRSAADARWRALVRFRTRWIGAAVDRIDRAWQCLGVALHFRGEFTHLRGVREMAALIGHHSDRQGHHRHPMKLTTPILPKKVTCPPILVRVLERDQGIEDEDDFLA